MTCVAPGGGGRGVLKSQKFLKESMKKNWKLEWWGVQTKKPPWRGGYGYFLEPHSLFYRDV